MGKQQERPQCKEHGRAWVRRPGPDPLMSCALEGLGELSSFPCSPDSGATRACPALWAERGAVESVRCFLGRGSLVTCGIINRLVLPKPQSRLSGDQRNLTLNQFPIKLEALQLPLHIHIRQDACPLISAIGNVGTSSKYFRRGRNRKKLAII